MSTTYKVSEWLALGLRFLVGIVAVIGNTFILYVIWKHKMRNTTFYLVAAQAASDLLWGIIYSTTIWWVCSSGIVGQKQGLIACYIIFNLCISTFIISAYNMTAIAMERYLILTRPLATPRSPWIFIVLSWVISLASVTIGSLSDVAPQPEFFTSERLIGCRLGYYQLNLKLLEDTVGIVFPILGFFLPVSVTAVIYFQIMNVVSCKNKELLGIQRSEQLLLKEQRRQRMNRMLMFTVICYTVLCLPLQIAYQINRVKALQLHTCQIPWWYSLCNFFAGLTVVINPFIYYHFNGKFKKEGKRMLKLFKKQQSFTSDNNSTPDPSSSDQDGYNRVVSLQ